MLTPTERAALKALRDYITSHGQAPTISELAQMLGLNSRSHTSTLLINLEQQGYIRRHPRRHRGIELIQKTEEDTRYLALQKIAEGLSMLRESDQLDVDTLGHIDKLLNDATT